MNCYFSLYRFLFVIVTFISVVVLSSCKKTLQDESPSYDRTTVSFRVTGVNSETGISKLGMSEKSVFIAETLNQSKVNTISKNVSLEVNQSVENIPSYFDNMSDVLDKGLPSSKTRSKMASVNSLSSDAKFRLVLINSSGVIVHNEQASSDDIITFELIVGEQYSWYAYSYGDADDIPVSAGEIVNTPLDKHFLYAKSITPLIGQANNNSVSIVFEHQVALISIELDYDKLYAEIPADASNASSISTNFDWSLNNLENAIYSADFSLRTGQVSNHLSADPVNLNEILRDHPTDRNVKVAQLYTVAPPNEVTPTTSFSVTLNLLKVRYPNMAVGTTVSLIGDGKSTVPNTFTGLTIEPGKKFVAKFKLKYTFPPAKILQVIGTAAAGFVGEHNSYGSYRMLIQGENFSTSYANSIFNGHFWREVLATVTGLEAALHLDSGTPPDIVVLGGNYILSANDITALMTYLDRGGVLFLLTGDIYVNAASLPSHQEFLRTLFDTPSLVTSQSAYAAGSVYNLSDYDDRILNGPFGDVRSQYWGKYFRQTIVLTNFPESEIVPYSWATPVNSNETNLEGVTMFKHKKRHVFWVGDGSFIYASTNDTSPMYPFAVSDPPQIPVSHAYGIEGGGVAARTYHVSNSILYGNFLAWASANANFFGINHGGLGLGPYHEF